MEHPPTQPGLPVSGEAEQAETGNASGSTQIDHHHEDHGRHGHHGKRKHHHGKRERSRSRGRSRSRSRGRSTSSSSFSSSSSSSDSGDKGFKQCHRRKKHGRRHGKHGGSRSRSRSRSHSHGDKRKCLRRYGREDFGRSDISFGRKGFGKWKKMGKKCGMMKEWKRGMKEAHKMAKHRRFNRYSQKGHNREDERGHSEGDPLKEDIFVYMGNYMQNEVSVSVMNGYVKISGNHASADTRCRPHSVMHMYKAPDDAQREHVTAVLYPRGVLHVRYRDQTEMPIEVPVGDAMTETSAGVADMNIEAAD